MDLKGNSVTWVGHATWIWETSEGRRVMHSSPTLLHRRFAARRSGCGNRSTPLERFSVR